ncbi:unnamed protein product [Rodentolepis nana]|uniref:Uncharacterized protein n=1 Tax=Rodentolepis nana TaxID=102285 RepID=A0A0R3TRM5_RODNA|nr:unnamed protein product [Rodentolepis nana]
MTPTERPWKQSTAGARCVSNVHLYETQEPRPCIQSYPYRSLKLQLTTASQPASQDQSSGKHTPEDFDHGLSQPNIRSTRTLNTDHCIWSNIQQGARHWTEYCLTRSARKVHKHARSPQSYCLSLQQSHLNPNPVTQRPKIYLPLPTS